MTPIDYTNIPRTLNGSPVKAFSISADNSRALVLVHRENTRLGPWVAATWWPELQTEWQWGNYFQSYEEADAYRRQWLKTHGSSTAASIAMKLTAKEAGQ